MKRRGNRKRNLKNAVKMYRIEEVKIVDFDLLAFLMLMKIETMINYFYTNKS